jgi:hypothetical protein
VLTASTGWGSTQALIVLALGLLLAAIVVPAFFARRYRNEGPSR